MIKKVFNSYFENYDDWFDKNRGIYQSEVLTIREAVDTMNNGIEIGVGTGRFASKLGIPIGIDLSINMLKRAKQYGVKVVYGNAEYLPFKDNIFDNVLLMVTLCFLENPYKVIKECWRILKYKSHIIIGIIDKNSSLAKYYLRKNSPFYKIAKFYSVNEVVNLLQNAGFENFSFWQNLFEFPPNKEKVSLPKKGYGEGAFVVIKGVKGE